MKVLKLNHDAAKLVLSGEMTSTWRLFDDKNIGVDNEIEFIDKVDSTDAGSWIKIGVAKVGSVIEKKFANISDSEKMGQQQFSSDHEMYETFSKYYDTKVAPDSIVKIINFTFEPYKKAKKMDEEALKLDVSKIYTDGGSRGNPGPSAIGVVILDVEDNVVKKTGVYIGITTNNQAEYQALKLGVEQARDLGVKKLTVYMDSLLVVNQMKGLYKVKNMDLAPIYQTVSGMLDSFKHVDFVHVPRELNKIADGIVNDTLDAQ